MERRKPPSASTTWPVIVAASEAVALLARSRSTEVRRVGDNPSMPFGSDQSGFWSTGVSGLCSRRALSPSTRSAVTPPCAPRGSTSTPPLAARRSPTTVPGFPTGRPPRDKDKRYAPTREGRRDPRGHARGRSAVRTPAGSHRRGSGAPDCASGGAGPRDSDVRRGAVLCAAARAAVAARLRSRTRTVRPRPQSRLRLHPVRW